MAKTKEELMQLKNEFEELKNKLKELTKEKMYKDIDDEMKQLYRFYELKCGYVQ